MTCYKLILKTNLIFHMMYILGTSIVKIGESSFCYNMFHFISNSKINRTFNSTKIFSLSRNGNYQKIVFMIIVNYSVLLLELRYNFQLDNIMITLDLLSLLLSIIFNWYWRTIVRVFFSSNLFSFNPVMIIKTSKKCGEMT